MWGVFAVTLQFSGDSVECDSGRRAGGFSGTGKAFQGKTPCHTDHLQSQRNESAQEKDKNIKEILLSR